MHLKWSSYSHTKLRTGFSPSDIPTSVCMHMSFSTLVDTQANCMKIIFILLKEILSRVWNVTIDGAWVDDSI
jgi:hypothetical protein